MCVKFLYTHAIDLSNTCLYGTRVRENTTDPDLEDLGWVNDFRIDSDHEDDDDENREAIGDQSSTETKWHKHTVKVLKLLQRRLRPAEGTAAATTGDGDDDEEGQDDDNDNKVSAIRFKQLSQHCTRRTAASVFFEMLQLKTWDFIELDQNEPYGDITITPGIRFSEAPPEGNKK